MPALPHNGLNNDFTSNFWEKTQKKKKFPLRANLTGPNRHCRNQPSQRLCDGAATSTLDHVFHTWKPAFENKIVVIKFPATGPPNALLRAGAVSRAQLQGLELLLSGWLQPRSGVAVMLSNCWFARGDQRGCSSLANRPRAPPCRRAVRWCSKTQGERKTLVLVCTALKLPRLSLGGWALLPGEPDLHAEHNAAGRSQGRGQLWALFTGER